MPAIAKDHVMTVSASAYLVHLKCLHAEKIEYLKSMVNGVLKEEVSDAIERLTDDTYKITDQLVALVDVSSEMKELESLITQISALEGGTDFDTMTFTLPVVEFFSE